MTSDEIKKKIDYEAREHPLGNVHRDGHFDPLSWIDELHGYTERMKESFTTLGDQIRAMADHFRSSRPLMVHHSNAENRGTHQDIRESRIVGGTISSDRINVNSAGISMNDYWSRARITNVGINAEGAWGNTLQLMSRDQVRRDNLFPTNQVTSVERDPETGAVCIERVEQNDSHESESPRRRMPRDEHVIYHDADRYRTW